MATNEPLLESRALALASAGRVSSEESGVSTVDGDRGFFHNASTGPSGSSLMIALSADFIGAIREVKYGWGVAPFCPAALHPIHLISAAILDRLAKSV